jgi:hypothetical protein
MTIEQLEKRVTLLEQEFDRLRGEIRLLGPLKSVSDTFGMFANDPEFDEIIRLGREYRDQVNREDV